MNQIAKRIKPASPERTLIQAKIPTVLFEKLKKKLDADKITWRQFFEAAAGAYLEE